MQQSAGRWRDRGTKAVRGDSKQRERQTARGPGSPLQAPLLLLGSQDDAAAFDATSLPRLSNSSIKLALEALRARRFFLRLFAIIPLQRQAEFGSSRLDLVGVVERQPELFGAPLLLLRFAQLSRRSGGRCRLVFSGRRRRRRLGLRRRRGWLRSGPVCGRRRGRGRRRRSRLGWRGRRCGGCRGSRFGGRSCRGRSGSTAGLGVHEPLPMDALAREGACAPRAQGGGTRRGAG